MDESKAVIWKYVALFGGTAIVGIIFVVGLAASYERGVDAGSDQGFVNGLNTGITQVVTERDRLALELEAELLAEGQVEGRREVVDGLLVSIAQSGAVRIVRGDDVLVLVQAQLEETPEPTPGTIDPAATPVPTP